MQIPVPRLLPLLLLLSVAWADEEVAFDRDGDSIVVRSAPGKRNFLFRAPARFEPSREVDEGTVFLLTATAEGSAAGIRLRMEKLTAAQARQNLDAIALARVKRWQTGYARPTRPVITGNGERRVANFTGRANGALQSRTVLLLRNGEDLYELYLDAGPADSELAKSLEGLQDVFAILDVKEAPARRKATPAELKAKPLEHDYYRLKLIKPEGFEQEEPDAAANPGLVFHFRAEGDTGNTCIIRIKVKLAKTVKRAGNSAESIAQKAMDDFRKKYKDVRGPKRLKRSSAYGSKESYKLSLTGRHPRGNLLTREERRVFDHANGRIYDIWIVSYGNAGKVYKKQISNFWRKLKVVDK